MFFFFTQKISANRGKMLNIVTDLLEGDWKLDISKASFSEPSRATKIKVLGIDEKI